MAEFNFNKDYLHYWKERVDQEKKDGKVAGREIVKFYLDKMGIKKDGKLLDIGCGFGRLYPVLSDYSNFVYGIDVDLAMIDKASVLPYTGLNLGTAENTNLPFHYFSTIVCWAVYDVVEQVEALCEENRILRTGGSLLITGKNIQYPFDDHEAFIAERNAKLKRFPNHFTHVRELMSNINVFGFEIELCYGFYKRGDFGRNYSIDLLENNKEDFYEFCMILKKIENIIYTPKIEITDEYSQTARAKARKNGYFDIKKYFQDHMNNVFVNKESF